MVGDGYFQLVGYEWKGQELLQHFELCRSKIRDAEVQYLPTLF